jgi:hypothetical protein
MTCTEMLLALAPGNTYAPPSLHHLPWPLLQLMGGCNADPRTCSLIAHIY